jgi:hypothetical protein
MYGWSRHDTLGNFKSVATITEGNIDATYFVVERPSPIDGITPLRSIERLANREFPFGAEDAWSVDCGAKTVSFFPNSTLRVSAATGSVQLDVTTPLFTGSTVGWIIRVGGGIIEVTQAINTTVSIGIVR